MDLILLRLKGLNNKQESKIIAKLFAEWRAAACARALQITINTADMFARGDAARLSLSIYKQQISDDTARYTYLPFINLGAYFSIRDDFRKI